jgi:hypothetical protein
MPRKQTKRSEGRSQKLEADGQSKAKGLEGQRRVGTPRGERHRVIESMSFVEGFCERDFVNGLAE